MDIESIYNKVRSYTDMAERRLYLKSLTEEERSLYIKYRNKINAKKFNDNPEKRKEYNERRKEHIKKAREENPEKFQEQNLKDIKAFREREKKKKALIVITNAVRVRKAKQLLKKKKDLKEQITKLESLFKNL